MPRIRDKRIRFFIGDSPIPADNLFLNKGNYAIVEYFNQERKYKFVEKRQGMKSIIYLSLKIQKDNGLLQTFVIPINDSI
jgi:hypothetical protein